MTPIEIGLISVIAIVFLIYSGVYIPIALGLVSFVSIWLMRDNFTLALNLLKVAVGDSAMEYTFATIPLFTFMGLVVSKAGLGRDIYEAMTMRFRKVKGGIGMGTIGANAVFAAVAGSSIASASVFTKVSVPQMIAQDYNPRFAVGVVAGSSVLGMIIPPSAILIITIVLGGIYTGWLTAVEAGAAGALVALMIAVLRKTMTLGSFWDALLETGHITVAILFLIPAALIYSRMLGLAGLPNQLEDLLVGNQASFWTIMLLFVLLMLFLGTLLDTASIILIVVPLFLPLVEALDMSLIWFGIITVVGAEIGLLTPPLGISCFVIKSTIDDDRISLKDVFMGALPFAFAMLIVLMILIEFPILSLARV